MSRALAIRPILEALRASVATLAVVKGLKDLVDLETILVAALDETEMAGIGEGVAEVAVADLLALIAEKVGI